VVCIYPTLLYHNAEQDRQMNYQINPSKMYQRLSIWKQQWRIKFAFMNKLGEQQVRGNPATSQFTTFISLTDRDNQHCTILSLFIRMLVHIGLSH
jgi:hypothetical protein